MSGSGVPGPKTRATPISSSFGNVAFGDDAADEDADVLQAGLAQQLQDARHQRHVRAAEEAQAEPVGVLVGDGADDRLRASATGRRR